MPLPLIIATVLIGPLLHGIVDACGRTPAKPQGKTTPSPLPQPNVTSEPSAHRKQCTEAEVLSNYCLNDGECFAISLGGNRTLSCACPEMFVGLRCESISPDIFGPVVEQENVVTASIAAGVSVLVILLSMAIIYAVVRVKRRRNRQEPRKNGGPTNGTLIRQVESHDDDSVMEDDNKEKLLSNHINHNSFIHDCTKETNV